MERLERLMDTTTANLSSAQLMVGTVPIMTMDCALSATRWKIVTILVLCLTVGKSGRNCSTDC